MNLSAKLRELIAERAEPTTCAELCAALGLSPVPVSQALAVMWRAGLLVRHGEGRPYAYTLGREVLAVRGQALSASDPLAARRAKYRARRVARGLPVRELAPKREPVPYVRKRSAPKPAVTPAPKPTARIVEPRRVTAAPPPHTDVSADVARFIARGGAVERLPTGATSRPLRHDHGAATVRPVCRQVFTSMAGLRA